MTTAVLRSPVLAVGIVIGLVFGAAGLIGGDPPWRAAISTAIPIAYALFVTIVGRRSETVSVSPAAQSTSAGSTSTWRPRPGPSASSAIVILAAFIVADATGGDWMPYAFIGAVMAAAYVCSLAVIRLRS